MNSKRSYLDAVNAGRQRRSYASLEQLNKSLDSLEQRIERNREEVAGYGRDAQRRAPAQPYGQPSGLGFDSARTPAKPRAPEFRSAYDQPYQSIARDIEAFRRELADLGIEMKDPGIGLIDFPSTMGSRPIYLCWRLGESEVGYWHEIHAGYAGRQPLVPESVG